MPEMMGPHTAIRTEFGLPALMRDGVTLYADVYRPDTSDPVPVLLQRTPYGQSTVPYGQPRRDARGVPRLCGGYPGHPRSLHLRGRVLPLPG